MPGRAQLVIGAAGAGKTSYCKAVQDYCATTRRTVHLVNLDPAAEETDAVQYAIDIRDLITVSDAMEEVNLGPNGALVYCMEYLLDNLDWLDEELGGYDTDYLVIDCPGQIELYTHLPVMPRVIETLQRCGYTVCTVFCVDATGASDPARFLGAALSALSCMIHLHTPHVSVLTKVDLLPSPRAAARLCNTEPKELVELLAEDTAPRFAALNERIADLLQDFNMVGFVPLSIRKPKSVARVLGTVDFALQYGEDEEPKEPRTADWSGAGDDG